jgi:hypothetical protein
LPAEIHKNIEKITIDGKGRRGGRAVTKSPDARAGAEHISAVERAGLRSLNEGQQIEFEIEENRAKTSAVNLRTR